MIRLLLCLLFLAAPASAQAPPQLDRLQRADSASVVPDRFLRSWDPVTVLLPADTGPAGGGPEDRPERFATLDPPHPGAWTWLGPRTLQFRPAEPWQPLRRETVTVGGSATRLVPLLPLPVSTAPDSSDTGIAGLDTVALTFAAPVELDALKRLITLELAPQPGLPGAVQTLTQADFDVRPVERAARGDTQTYLVVLRRPVPDGRIATLRLRLSDEPGLDDPTFELTLRSAVPFGVTDTYCGDGFSHSAVDGATVCKPDSDSPAAARRLVLQFSSKPAELDPVQARDTLRFTPPVDDLQVSTGGENELRLQGKFAPGTAYTLAIAPGTLKDTAGRVLAKPVLTRFSFTSAVPSLNWDAREGIVERLGPQMAPLRGFGFDRADIRVHPIDPLSRDFWPFPRAGVTTQDEAAPPLPGNEPAHYADAGPISGDDMAARIKALGSPAASALVDLPIRRGGVDTKFGIDLAPILAGIAGPQQPGAYLVGLRPVNGSTRQWMRIQVTDLTLSTVEEADRVRFVVTSLSTAQPVEGAEIRLEGTSGDDFATLAHGVTGPDGAWVLAAPLPKDRNGEETRLRRIVVTKATDTLVLDPQRGPQQYAAGNWTRPGAPWLGWMASDPADRREQPRTLCHVFTERPIYRPEDPILIGGMIRRYRSGALAFAQGQGEVVITGPNQQEWRIPAPLDDAGGFHVRFDQKTDATGEYAIQYEPADGEGCGGITVKKEAYRLPTFEVVLSGPERTPLDQPFAVNALARFFAGGTLSERPLQWRVTQTPYVWSPPGREGFVFSSDSRYAGETNFRSTAVLNRETKTDAGGSAQLVLDPLLEPTAQPRQYLVEATVTGDDDVQVRGVQRITALPPFVLGLKVPRYIAQAGAVDPEILALDGDGKPVVGLPMTVRLIHRQWNSLLQASDFAQGSARYQTQVFDETVEERQVTSAVDPAPMHFGLAEAGVYLVEVSAEDKAGRRQTVRVDLFAAGATPVTWSRPPSQTITLSADKESYAPGETASVIIQSPFQTARALAVVEEPEGRFRTQWVDIANGFGRLAVPLRKQQVPRLAVHVLLMRGRLPETSPASAPFDQGKPVTLAGTKWLTVTPVENRLRVTFDAPATARPGEEIDLVLHLADQAGRPLAGEATVWLLDQAVLALAKEQPLDPLPAFIVDRPSKMAARDTRNMAFGVLPLQENPGGSENGDFGMENISVRKNFTPVPFYQPRVRVGPDGTARLRVKLPDTLTVFMLRAKAISGPDRFGFGAGQLRVRQPVVAQPALPRFVRVGDTFAAGLIGRIVEGPGGPGRALLSLDNLQAQGATEQALTWDGGKPARVDFPVTVPEPAAGVTTARVRMLLQRTSDRVSDAVQIELPIRPDRPVIHRRDLLATGPSGLDIAPIADPVRPASYLRQVTVATDPEATRLVAGVGALVRFPVGGTEQRIALATGELALQPFAPLIAAAGLRERIGADVAAAIEAVRRSADEDGLVAFWPRTRGNVWLTAAAYRMMVAAGRAGLPVDKPMLDGMAKVLAASLRSDYPHLLTEAALFERVAALTALADGGTIQAADAAELARRAQMMPTGSVAEIATVLARLPQRDDRLLAEVVSVLWSRVNFLSRDGKPAYAGLTDARATAEILPSEARSLAQVVQAVATAAPTDPRLPVLRSGLLGLASGQGWGSTNATAAALRALAAAWQAPPNPVAAGVTLPDRPVTGTLDRDRPLLQASTTRPGPARVTGPAGLAVLAATDYVPLEPGAQARAEQHGFVLTRTLYRVPPADAPMQRLDPAADGTIQLAVGDVVEEVDELVTQADRAQVALHLPLPAGLEPLNPALANAPAEATPSAGPTVPAAWSSFGDDEVLHVWLTLPRGTAVLRTRMRATVAGSFTAPPATAEMLYEPGVTGSSSGQRIVVARSP